MEFRILGPLEVRDQGHPLALTAAKQRTLLAILLVHANEVVSSDRLIDGLWGERPPPTAANALQVYVTQVRRLLEPDRERGAPSRALPSQAGGYVLRIEPEALDAGRFERQLAAAVSARERGDAGGAAQGLRRALGLWRGPALADFTYEPFAQSEIARLEEMRLNAREERIEADLALGAHAAVVGELEGLVDAHPLRERLRGQLMLALYRSGRQAEAIDVYRETHRALMDELGIAPSPALRELERAILRQAPELADPRRPAEAGGPTPRSAGTASDAAGAEAGGELASREATPEEERRKIVTVLVLDRGSRSESDPEARRRLEERELEAMTAVIERHGGSVESVMGARVMAVFGVPLTHEDDAVRALRAAAELSEASGRARAPERGEGAGARGGIATGEIVAGRGPLGPSSVAGAPMAAAAGLADAAPWGAVLVGAETRALAGRSARLAAVGAPSHAWRLIELVSEPPILSGASATPMVGREPELAQLRQVLDRAGGERTVCLFTVIGVPGIGKSRLAQELASRVAGDATVVAGRCIPYGEGITFWPLREIVAQLIAERPLAELLAAEDDAGVLAETVGAALVAGNPSVSREEIFVSFRRLVEAASRERPVVCVFEDVHWAEPTLLDLIEYLAERAREAPLLLLCLARPELLEERPGWGGGKPNSSSLLLERLSDAEAEELINQLGGGLSPATRARVQAAAEGNPLFLGQILALLSEAEPPAGEVPIPATIKALLAARLDRLGPGERAAIDRAAVIGKELWTGAVARLLPEDAGPFALRHLEALVRKELLSPARSLLAGEQAFRFRHILIQQAAYRAIPGSLRGFLHEGFADWLEDVAGPGEYPELAGYHLEQAHRHRERDGATIGGGPELAARAADRLAIAGRRAFDRGDMPASAGLLRRACSLLAPAAPSAPSLLSDLGYASFEIGEFDRADDALARAELRARELGDRAVEWSAIVKRGNVGIYLDPAGVDLDRLEDEARQAIGALTDLDDEPGLARAWTALAEVLHLRGRLLEAGRACRRAAEHARRAGSRREEAWAFGELGFCLYEGPTRVSDAISELERILANAEGDPVMAANEDGFLALQEAMAGRIDSARERVAGSLALTRDLGLRWQAGIHGLLSAYVEQLAGNPAAAERYMISAKEAFEEIGDRWFVATVSVDLPRPVYEQGRFDEALSLVEAIDDLPVPWDPELQIKRQGVRSLLLARSGSAEEALGVARETVALAAASEFLRLHGEALLDLADVLEIADRPEESAAAAREAVQVHERKGNVVGAAGARALLERLPAP